MIDIAQAPGRMISEWARTSGRAKPVTTTTEVMNPPRSSGPDPSSSAENSSEPQWENRALGRGAKTKVKAAFETGSDQIFSNQETRTTNAPTRRGSQFDHRAHERMINRNPTARTKDKRMTAVDGSRLDCVQCVSWDVNRLFNPATAMIAGEEVGFGRLLRHLFTACLASSQCTSKGEKPIAEG